MQEKNGIMVRIKDIINGSTDAERDRKASMQGKIDQADHVFQFFLLFPYLRNNLFYKWSTCDNILYYCRYLLRFYDIIY